MTSITYPFGPPTTTTSGRGLGKSKRYTKMLRYGPRTRAAPSPVSKSTGLHRPVATLRPAGRPAHPTASCPVCLCSVPLSGEFISAYGHRLPAAADDGTHSYCECGNGHFTCVYFPPPSVCQAAAKQRGASWHSETLHTRTFRSGGQRRVAETNHPADSDSDEAEEQDSQPPSPPPKPTVRPRAPITRAKPYRTLPPVPVLPRPAPKRQRLVGVSHLNRWRRDSTHPPLCATAAASPRSHPRQPEFAFPYDHHCFVRPEILDELEQALWRFDTVHSDLL